MSADFGGKAAAADLAWDRGSVALRMEGEDLAQLLEQLYQEHYDGLYRHMRLCGCQPADSDEFLQEAFFRLFRFLKDGNKVEKPRLWLLRVLHNLKADQGREDQRKAGISDTELGSEFAAAVDTAPDPELAVLKRERYRQIQDALSGLTERQYQYLLLRVQGLKLREIAEIHGVTVQSVAKACARAIEHLGRISDE